MAGDVSPDRPLMHEAGDEGRIAAFGASDRGRTG
jgi:pyruvate/2-oxoglutarate dehydrogenase complex dihydrolipoamide dehydrogenase (E3) component